MKLKVNEIVDYLLGLGPMYNAPNFQEVLALNDTGSFTKTFIQLLKKSLSEFELKYPLFMWDRKIYIPQANVHYQFEDNYDALLKGDITEDSLQLIPTSVVHYTDGLLRSYRDFSYVMPNIRIPRKGVIKVSYFAKYPHRFTMDKHEDKFTDDAHIYGISELSGVDFTYLMYIIEYNLCIYLRDQRAQMSYIDLPIEFYQNLDTRIGELYTDIQDWHQNPIWYSKLLI